MSRPKIKIKFTIELGCMKSDAFSKIPSLTKCQDSCLGKSYIHMYMYILEASKRVPFIYKWVSQCCCVYHPFHPPNIEIKTWQHFSVIHLRTCIGSKALNLNPNALFLAICAIFMKKKNVSSFSFKSFSYNKKFWYAIYIIIVKY